MERIDLLFQSDNPITGIPTGWPDFDDKTAGLQPGDLIVIAGRPSMGKTSLAMNIVEYAAIQVKCPVAVFSMETVSYTHLDVYKRQRLCRAGSPAPRPAISGNCR